jgi:hypothetical protein
MKIDENPFPKDVNMVDIKLLKGNAKVLTLDRAKEARTVDPKVKILTNEYKKIRQQCDKRKSRYEQGEISRAGAMSPRITSRILLNKWKHQQEKDYRRWLEEEEYRCRCEEERYEREQAESH